ncbi:MAG TPA: hypothetical protein VEO54_30970 [Thermoanaerobaculia bacterium]|nr:hypothetical protein [Thermoanaerobaculia bacterium]
MNDYEFDSALMLSGRYFDKIVILLDEVARPIHYPAPPELHQSLTQMVKGIFGDTGDLLLFSEPGINYTIVDLVEKRLIDIRIGLNRYDFQPPAGPERIFLVGLPSAESDQALIHCIIAHEFGHKVWDESDVLIRLQLSASVKPFMYLDKEEEQVAAVEVATEWLLELASDLFGLYIFGPAYVCAAIHYATAVTALDEASKSHPPTRVRLHLLFGLMDEMYTKSMNEQGGREFAYGPNMSQLFDMWRPAVDASRLGIAQMSSNVDERYARTAFAAIRNPDRVKELRSMARGLAQERYGAYYKQENYVRDMGLVRSIRNFIPPVQFLNEGKSELTSVPGILNACWEYYLGGLEQFGSVLPATISSDRFALSAIFNEFVLKTLELSGLAGQWREANGS